MTYRHFCLTGLYIMAASFLLPIAPRPAFAQNQGAAAQAAFAASPDAGWPRVKEKGGSKIVMYQPQVDSWQDNARIAARAAIAVTPAGQTEPSLGVLSIKAITTVDMNTRTVTLENLDITSRFPEVPDQKEATLQGMVKEALPQNQNITVSLDRVLAYMKKGKVDQDGVKGLGMSPPPIFFSTTPTILVTFIGQPKFAPIPNTALSFAANTNWDFFQDQATKQYFLRNGDSWLTAPDPLKGPWSAVQSLPDAFSKLPSDSNWSEVRAHIPGTPAQTVPAVLTSTVPAELILTEGEPAFTSISGTSLGYVTNPQMPVFFDTDNKTYYYLTSGRWFSASALQGPWQSANTQLPDDFSKIPEDNPMSYCLASVPNTQAAEDAVLLASIPRKATIDRATAKVNVTFKGDPKFAPIQGTNLQYAINSPQQIILAQNKYYCCYQGVWFVADAATGPYAVATSVPPEIYLIPPTNPNYNTTYVHIYNSTPDTVDVGYTGGYMGEYVAPTGTLMFGAGMALGAALEDEDDYEPWYCYPAPYYSYGGAYYYNYASGGFHPYGGPWYGPYGGVSYSSNYNPATGTYSRSATAWGPAGEASSRAAYNPYTGNYAARAGATNGYESWGRSVAQVGGTSIQAAHRTGPEGGSAGWIDSSSGRGAVGVQGPEGRSAVKTAGGDLYAGSDGNVYRRNDTGQWQSYHPGQGGWQDFNRPTPYSQQQQQRIEQQRAQQARVNQQRQVETQQRLNQQAYARDYGNQRTYQAQQYRSADYSRPTYSAPRGGASYGGYRGGGGARMGGGGRR